MIKKDKKSKDNKKQVFKIKNWYSNRYQLIIVQRNILLVFTIICIASMMVSVIFVKHIIASKSLEPYLIEVEEKTGVVTVVDQMTTADFTGNEIMKKYFINQFIQSSTAYNPRTYKIDLEIVRLLSSPAVYSNFRKRINAKKLGVDSKITVRIKSIQFPSPNNAQIRILRNINNNGKKETKNEIITISFFFGSDVELTMEERLINPLGFQVVSYSIAEEIFDY